MIFHDMVHLYPKQSLIRCSPPALHWSSWTETSRSLSKSRRVSVHSSASLTFPLTWASIALVACVRDLGSQVQVVLPLFRHSVVCPDADHAAREARQVAHLVIQDASPPLSHVGETTRWLLDQVGFDRLQQHTRSGVLYTPLLLLLCWHDSSTKLT